MRPLFGRGFWALQSREGLGGKWGQRTRECASSRAHERDRVGSTPHGGWVLQIESAESVRNARLSAASFVCQREHSR